MVYIYFLLIRIATLFGHAKARQIVAGQAAALKELEKESLPASSDKQRIWFHAASVGEFEQARPIIERLRAERGDRVQILVTFFSPSGYEMRKNYALADKVMYLPFATRQNAKRFISFFKPETAIFVKYEFWPAYLRTLHKEGIRTYLISGIFRDKQLFFRPWGGAYRRLLQYFTELFVQDKHSAELLHSIGIDNVTVAGDTRFDRVWAVCNTATWTDAVIESFLGIQEGEPRPAYRVIVAGSTWHEDEQLLARYVEEHDDVKLIIAPHEIDASRLHDVFNTFIGRMVRYTEATPLNVKHVQVLVVDTMGMLSKIYRYGDAAYVGGGFGVGIHNTLEPAVYGIPVLFGPKYTHFREAVGLVNVGAGFPVRQYDDFARQMDTALDNHVQLGAKAKEYIQSELGATDKIYHRL